jgi:hypothetical protein
MFFGELMKFSDLRTIAKLNLMFLTAVILLSADCFGQSNLSNQSPTLPKGQTALSINNVSARNSRIKSYREWKHDLVMESQSKISLYRIQIDALKPHSPQVGRNPSVDKLEKNHHEEAYALDIAKELTVTDYFVGYLTKVQNKKAAFQEVAGKLTPDEVAELITAYANSVLVTQSVDFPPSAANFSKDTVK